MSEEHGGKALDNWIGRLRVTPEKAADHADLDRLRCLLFSNEDASVLIVLQGLDAAGKGGTIRHVLTGLNPQGARVAALEQPTPDETVHDFLWRAHKAVPRKGEVAIFNRSHYEHILVVRVHDLAPKSDWQVRFEQINAFEALPAVNGTRVLKFFPHISPEEQLARFAKRPNDPARQWKSSETDYSERTFWPAYARAYEEVLTRCSTVNAPWYVIPSDRMWVRNHTVARIIAHNLDKKKLKTSPVRVDHSNIRRRYHDAVRAKA